MKRTLLLSAALAVCACYAPIQGGIVIDAYDRNAGQIWHGAARTEIDPARPNLSRLELAFDAALVPLRAEAMKRGTGDA